jgi:hypothetical protein
MQIEELSENVRKAKEAVTSLEEPLKTEAFKKILDKLLEEGSIQKVSNKKKRSSSVKSNKSNKRIKEESESRKRNLASKINRTEHVEIHNLTNALTKSLYVLNMMKEKGEDGLTPPEISFILKEIFREKVNPPTVSMALKDAHKYVDRDKIIIGHAVAYVYKIMKNGEDYLKNILKKISKENHTSEKSEGETAEGSSEE